MIPPTISPETSVAVTPVLICSTVNTGVCTIDGAIPILPNTSAKATTVSAAATRPNSAGVSRRDRIMRTRIFSTACALPPPNIQRKCPREDWVNGVRSAVFGKIDSLIKRKIYGCDTLASPPRAA